MALRLAGELLGVLRGMDSAGWLREVTTSDALAGLRVDQLGTGRIVDFRDGGASKLHVLDGGRVVVADSIEIGSAPATLGAVRLANNTMLMARNSGNTTDVPLVALDDSSVNVIELGNSAIAAVRIGHASQPAIVLAPTLGLVPLSDAVAPLGSTSKRWIRGVFSESLQVGTNPATTGAIRIPNNTTMTARNSGNTTDVPLVALDDSAVNVIELGNSAIAAVRIGHTGQPAAVIAPTSGLAPLSDAVAPLGSTAKRWTSGFYSGAVIVGTNPATTGAVRLGNAAGVSGRNAANVADIPLIEVTSGNVVRIASTGAGARISDTGGSLGFFGTPEVVRRTSAADLTNNVTAGGVDDTIANYTDLTTYANDAAAIRNNMYQLARQLKQINDGLRAYGLFG
jgi:hypothetical protein